MKEQDSVHGEHTQAAGSSRSGYLRRLGKCAALLFGAGLVAFGVWYVWFFRTARTDMFQRLDLVEVGMNREQVDAIFEGYSKDEGRFWLVTGPPLAHEFDEGKPGPERSAYSNPTRTFLQNAEHATVHFDSQGLVSSMGTTLDP